MSRDGNLRIPDVPKMERKYRDRWALWQAEWAKYRSASVSHEEEQLAGDLGSPETGLRISSTGDDDDDKRAREWKINKMKWGRHGKGVTSSDEKDKDKKPIKTSKDALTTSTWRETVQGGETTNEKMTKDNQMPVKEEENSPRESKTKGKRTELTDDRLAKWGNPGVKTKEGRLVKEETWSKGRKTRGDRKTTNRVKTKSKKEGMTRMGNGGTERRSAGEDSAWKKEESPAESKDKMLITMALISLIICIVASVITFVVTRGEKTASMSVM